MTLLLQIQGIFFGSNGDLIYIVVDAKPQLTMYIAESPTS